MVIYNIEIDVSYIGVAVYLVFICAVLFVAYHGRSFLISGGKALLSVLKIKHNEYDEESRRDKAVLLSIWVGFTAFILLAIILIGRLCVQQGVFIYEAHNADSIVCGEITEFEYENEYYRGEYLGKSVTMTVNDIKVCTYLGGNIDDESFEKLCNAKVVSVIYFEYEGKNEIVKITVEE